MDTFGTKKNLELVGQDRTVYCFQTLAAQGHNLARLPFSLKILLENLLRCEDGKAVTKAQIDALLAWDPKAAPSTEISYTPARVLMQDFTGVPCVVDLAAMRDAMAELGGDPTKVNPLQPVELVIDHSVQVDSYGTEASLNINLDLEFDRNGERYAFLKWGQSAFDNFKVVPPNTGICHQVNLEYLSRVVFENHGVCYPDTLVGTDSHTTMVNGLGVLGWGVGGIEAEAAMLGQPIPMLIPQVVGFKISGKLREGTTATDLVLTVTEMLRKHGVVGKFVEFFGPGIATLPLADRATIANMAPEYGATCGIFPVDNESLRYLRISGRDEDQINLVEEYMRHQGMFHTPESTDAEYSSVLELALETVEPSVAGPKRPQDRSPLSKAKDSYFAAFPTSLPAGYTPTSSSSSSTAVLEKPLIDSLTHGSVVIAAITSCTNTSNPSVMVAAGLVAKKARQLGLLPKPWVKTSLAPGSRVVTEYLQSSGLLDELDSIGFNVVGYGCTTCIGNSGPLPDEVNKVIEEQNLTVVSVLSGNRNFEGRVQQAVKANYLMSPPLVVAYSLAGTIAIDLANDPIGKATDGSDVFLKDIWPTQEEIATTVESCVTREMFSNSYKSVFDGDDKWKAIEVTGGQRYGWGEDSTYIKRATYFDGMPRQAPSHVQDIRGLKVLAMLGDSVTTDHISPAGNIKASSPAGEYLTSKGVSPALYNSYGSRRGNHEVMIRGTFANVRLKNLLAPGTEGGFTTYPPGGVVSTIFDAATKYQAAEESLLIIAGKEYGTGSSRDWAAKGTMLLGVKVVLAESFERIHRSNLIGMGVLPLQFKTGDTATSLGLTGKEEYAIVGFSEAFDNGFKDGKVLRCRATNDDGSHTAFDVTVRIDTPTEADYYLHGGILQYVLRQLLNS